MTWTDKELITDIPLTAIMNVTRPAGAHPSKLPSPHMVPRIVRAHAMGYRPTPMVMSMEDIPGNLSNEEYRFWIGSRETTARLTKCRFCHVHRFTKEERKGHHDWGHCTENLLKIYKWMRSCQPRLCTVCEFQTFFEKWGVPLCRGQQCINRWKFEFNMHERFSEVAHRLLIAGVFTKNPIGLELQK